MDNNKLWPISSAVTSHLPTSSPSQGLVLSPSMNCNPILHTATLESTQGDHPAYLYVLFSFPCILRTYVLWFCRIRQEKNADMLETHRMFPEGFLDELRFSCKVWRSGNPLFISLLLFFGLFRMDSSCKFWSQCMFSVDYDERHFHGKPQNSFHTAVNIPDVVFYPE